MSNIIPFPTNKHNQNKIKNYKETHNFKTISDWIIADGTITFTDLDGHDIKIDLNAVDHNIYNNKSPDYTAVLLDEIESCVSRDPLLAEYVNSNLERLLKTIKK